MSTSNCWAWRRKTHSSEIWSVTTKIRIGWCSKTSLWKPRSWPWEANPQLPWPKELSHWLYLINNNLSSNSSKVLEVIKASSLWLNLSSFSSKSRREVSSPNAQNHWSNNKQHRLEARGLTTDHLPSSLRTNLRPHLSNKSFLSSNLNNHISISHQSTWALCSHSMNQLNLRCLSKVH